MTDATDPASMVSMCSSTEAAEPPTLRRAVDNFFSLEVIKNGKARVRYSSSESRERGEVDRCGRSRSRCPGPSRPARGYGVWHNMGERCELPHRGQGRSPRRQRFLHWKTLQNNAKTTMKRICHNPYICSVMPRPAFDNPVTFTAGRLDIDGHVHGQGWTV